MNIVFNVIANKSSSSNDDELHIFVSLYFKVFDSCIVISIL